MQIGTDLQFVVLGLGISGLAAVRFLHSLGAQVMASENRSLQELDQGMIAELLEMGVELETDGHTPEFVQYADVIVPSPGVPLNLPCLQEAVAQGKIIAGEMALAAGRITAPVIGVTGSNGKTTVSSLIGHLLESDGRRVFVGGNIGTPVLDYLRGPQDAEIIVLELSSFQLEISGEFRPDIALLLNLSPDHIDRHGTVEKYVAAKQRIFANQEHSDTAIIEADDPLVVREKITTAGNVLSFGEVPADARIDENGVLVRKGVFGADEEYYDLTSTLLASKVNRLNAAAAILAARSYGCKPESIRKGIAGFCPPPHRMSLVAEIDGVKYIDDSKGTNVGAVAAALASSGERVILIAGGRDKDSDFTLLAEQVGKRVRKLILIGEAADRIDSSLGHLVSTSRAGSLDEAVRMSADCASRGDTVLLSPGCASFDMFLNYKQRGEAFRKAVLRLQKVSHNYH